MIASDANLTLWTVHERPKDYPDHFVARKWVVPPRGAPYPTKTAILGRTLEQVRAALPCGLTCLPRSECDEAQIVESWI